MPRPKPKNAAQNFIARGHPLSEAAGAELVALLGFGKVDLLEEFVRRQHPGMKILSKEPGALLQLVRDPDFVPSTGPDVGKIILDVEQVLGLYVNGAEHLDNVPRPADYREVFKPIQREAFKLFGTLNNLSEYYREQMDLRGAGFQELRSALGKLAGVSGDIVKDFQGQSSKGAPRNTALAEVTRRLRRIFRDNYRGPRTARARRGAFQSLADWERREEKFIGTALLSARIIPKGYRGLARLLRDPRCALPEDRSATIERIARKVHPAQREQKRNRR